MYKGEKLNAISHLVGAALALIGMVLLVVFASLTGDHWKIASVTIYGACLFLMFLFSTLYHSFRGKTRDVFQRLDHIGIFLLIAGTYTPYTLILMRETSGFLILGLVWGLAVCGITFKSIYGSRYNTVTTLFYLLCGWTIALDFTGVRQALPDAGFYWLAAGGLIYTGGAFFYLKESLPRNHEIWHFFVLAAAVCHFISIFFFVI